MDRFTPPPLGLLALKFPGFFLLILFFSIWGPMHRGPSAGWIRDSNLKSLLGCLTILLSLPYTLTYNLFFNVDPSLTKD